MLLLSVLIYTWLTNRLVVNCGRSGGGGGSVRNSGQRSTKSTGSRVNYMPPRAMVYRQLRDRRRGVLVNPLISRSIASQRTPLARFATFSKIFFPWFKIFKSPFCPFKPCLTCGGSGGGGGAYDDDYGPIIDPDLYPPLVIPSAPVIPSESTLILDHHANYFPSSNQNGQNGQHGSGHDGGNNNNHPPDMGHHDHHGDDHHDHHHGVDESDKDHGSGGGGDEPVHDKDEPDKDMGGEDHASGSTPDDTPADPPSEEPVEPPSDGGGGGGDSGDEPKDPDQAPVSEESKRRHIKVNDRSLARGSKSTLNRPIKARVSRSRGGRGGGSVGNSELRLINNDKRKSTVIMGNRQQVPTRNYRS